MMNVIYGIRRILRAILKIIALVGLIPLSALFMAIAIVIWTIAWIMNSDDGKPNRTMIELEFNMNEILTLLKKYFGSIWK